MRIRPSKIRYCQDSISNRFSDGTLIGEMVDDVMDGRMDVDDIDEISVMSHEGHWVSADNRRLWVFRKLEEFGYLEKISVDIIDYIPESKMTADESTRYGKDIRVRGNPGGLRCGWRFDSSSESDSDSTDDEDYPYF